jgi:hypothetical protein
MEPTTPSEADGAFAVVRRDAEEIIVQTALGEARLQVPIAEPRTAAIVIASHVEEALASLRLLGRGELASPRLPAAVSVFGSAESGAFVVIAPFDLHAYGRAQLGAHWREGFRLAFAVDLLAFHWSSMGATASGAALHLGLDVGARLRLEDVAFHVDGHALVGLPARPMSANAALVERVQLAGMFGGSIGVGYSLTHRIEIGLRVRADAVLDEDGRVFALLRLGLYGDFR